MNDVSAGTVVGTGASSSGLKLGIRLSYACGLLPGGLTMEPCFSPSHPGLTSTMITGPTAQKSPFANRSIW
jgi:hypothetical protein